MEKPRQPCDARSSTAHTRVRQLVSPGSRPMTFTRRRVSPKLRSMKLECRIRFQCSTGNRRCSNSEPRSRSRHSTAPGYFLRHVSENVLAFARASTDGGGAGFGIDVEDLPVVGLHGRLVGFGDLRQDVAGPVDRAALPTCPRVVQLHRGDQAGRTIGDHQQRTPQPAFDETGEEIAPGVGRFRRTAGQADQHGLSGGGDPPRREHWFGIRTVVVTEM